MAERSTFKLATLFEAKLNSVSVPVGHTAGAEGDCFYPEGILHSLGMRGAAAPVILFNLFSDGGLEQQPDPKAELT